MIRLLFISMLVFMSCSISNRKPSSIEEIDYRIGTLNFEHGKLVLVGVEAKRGALGFNAEELKFKPYFGKINNLDPKYLISTNNKGIQKVYVFEYGNSSRRRLKTAIEREKGSRRFYLKLKNRDHKPKLPKVLVDVPNVKMRKAPLSYTKIGSWAISFTPYQFISSLYTSLMMAIENKKHYQATSLTRIIEMAIVENKFPELIDILGEEELFKLGGALRIRYPGQNAPITTWLTNNKNKLAMFRDYIFLKDEFNSENMAKLVDRANQEGLYVLPVANDMAFLFYDLSERIDPALYDSKLLSQSKIDEIYKKYSHLENEKTHLVPLGLFLLGDSDSPTEGVDFIKPHKNVSIEKVTNIVTFAMDVGMAFFPIQFVASTYSVAKSVVQFTIRKSGRSQMFKKRIYSEAQLNTLMESGSLTLGAEQIAKEALIEQLKELDIDEDLIGSYEKRLDANVDNKELMEEIYLLFGEAQLDRRKVSKLDGQYRLVNKYIAWNRLKKFIQNDLSQKNFNNWLKERSDKNIINTRYEDRAPSSTVFDRNLKAIKPSIIFFIGGLTPEKIKLGIDHNLIPNIKKYFVDHGVQFDTYASQPLGLATQASILTGWSIDRHGLRSESPISRFDEKPLHNLRDSRREWFIPKYWDKSRGYRHIEASGATWFLDFITNKDYVYFNSMPIYNGGSTPVGHYIDEAIKKVPGFFNGIYAHDLVMDNASASKSLSLVRQNRGRYKLIVNWYRCVETFSKKSNRALYQCLTALDKNIGELIDTAFKDPVLKFADLYLISDAGQLGGFHLLKQTNGQIKETFLNNTGFNLTRFFAGDYNSHPYYVFPVSTFMSPEPDYNLKYLHEFYIEPTRYLYRGKNDKRRGDPIVMIDFFGDAQARLYFKHKTEDWNEKSNIYDLTNFVRENNIDRPINVIDDLLNFRLKNTEIVDTNLRNYILQQTDNRPIKWIAYNVSSEAEINSIKSKLKIEDDVEINIVMNKNKQTIVLTKFEETKMFVKFIPIKNLQGQRAGTISFKRDNDDIFGLSKFNAKLVNTWIEERESLKLLKGFKYPVLFSHFGRIFHNSPNLAAIPSRIGEIPDLLLYANEGFNFNSGHKTQADRGDIDERGTKISFYHGKVDIKNHDSKLSKQYNQDYQLFERDIAPFIMYQADPSVIDDHWDPHWNHLLPLFNEFYIKRP